MDLKKVIDKYPNHYSLFCACNEAQRIKAPIMVANEQMLVDGVIKSLKQLPELTDEMIEELQDIFEHYLREKNKKLIEY